MPQLKFQPKPTTQTTPQETSAPRRAGLPTEPTTRTTPQKTGAPRPMGVPTEPTTQTIHIKGTGAEKTRAHLPVTGLPPSESGRARPSPPSPTQTPPEPVLSFVEVPVGRCSELSRDIQSYRDQLEKTRGILRISQVQIAAYGGCYFAPPSLINQEDEAKKEAERLDKLIKAATREQYFQGRYETELCAFHLLRGELA